MSQPVAVTPESPAALINRELSWLSFARRVLALAEDPDAAHPFPFISNLGLNLAVLVTEPGRRNPISCGSRCRPTGRVGCRCRTMRAGCCERPGKRAYGGPSRVAVVRIGSARERLGPARTTPEGVHDPVHQGAHVAGQPAVGIERRAEPVQRRSIQPKPPGPGGASSWPWAGYPVRRMRTSAATAPCCRTNTGLRSSSAISGMSSTMALTRCSSSAKAATSSGGDWRYPVSSR